MPIPKLKLERIIHGKKKGYRSGFEKKIAHQLDTEGIVYGYESVKIKFVKPSTVHTYTPDFILPNGIIIETKGRFVPADRKKHILIQEQHPELDIRFVFCNSRTKLSKHSQTSYGDWCEKNGFEYADRNIPVSWLREPENRRCLQLINQGVIGNVSKK